MASKKSRKYKQLGHLHKKEVGLWVGWMDALLYVCNIVAAYVDVISRSSRREELLYSCPEFLALLRMNTNPATPVFRRGKTQKVSLPLLCIIAHAYGLDMHGEIRRV